MAIREMAKHARVREASVVDRPDPEVPESSAHRSC